MSNPRESILEVSVFDGKLQITIGLDALKTAIDLDPTFPEMKVVDIDGLAEELVSELHYEEEDGSTCVHRMLDRAVRRIVENGSENVRIEGE